MGRNCSLHLGPSDLEGNRLTIQDCVPITLRRCKLGFETSRLGSKLSSRKLIRKVRLSTKTVEAARAGIASVRAARAERMAAKPMKSTGNPFKGAGNAGATGTSDKQSAGGKAKRASAKNPGLVRSIASAAGKKIAEAATAKPRRVIRKAKARVKSLFGRSES